MMIQNVCARALKKNLPFSFSFADKIDTDVYEKRTHQLFRQQKKKNKKNFLTTQNLENEMKMFDKIQSNFSTIELSSEKTFSK